VICRVGPSESGPISRRINVKIHRCEWANNAALIDYHDHEWGVPIHNDRALFEFLVLEGMQAGLSWETVLRKRASHRVAFDDFDLATVAAYRRSKVRQLLANENIIRNKLKIEAAIRNAKLVLALQKEFGSFDEYVWRFVGGRPRQNKWQSPEDVPAQTAESNELSKDMRRYGFRFAGPTICYAFMQAVGMVNDHLVDCFRHKQVGSLA
jgi:DNA-3-methyladenine glycosylase I